MKCHVFYHIQNERQKEEERIIHFNEWAGIEGMAGEGDREGGGGSILATLLHERIVFWFWFFFDKFLLPTSRLFIECCVA